MLKSIRSIFLLNPSLKCDSIASNVSHSLRAKLLKSFGMWMNITNSSPVSTSTAFKKVCWKLILMSSALALRLVMKSVFIGKEIVRL